MVIHAHIRILVHVKLVHGRSGQTGPVVRSHVEQELESRLELEPEMKNVPKRVSKLRIVMDQEMSAVEPVTPGQHGQLALQHVMVELNQEVEGRARRGELHQTAEGRARRAELRQAAEEGQILKISHYFLRYTMAL